MLVCEPVPDWAGTTIHFEIAPTDAGGATLDFRHIGLTAQLECFDTFTVGWNQALAALLSYVDDGLDTVRSADSAYERPGTPTPGMW